MIQAAMALLGGVFLLYIVGYALTNLAINVIACVSLLRHMRSLSGDRDLGIYTGYEPPISVVVPAYNEEQGIAHTVTSILQLRYPEHEIIVVNDGSKDGMMDVLKREFQLEPFPEAYRARLATKPIRQIYQSRTHPNLRVIDKENGGKSDAVNAGLNIARYPLFCGIDADSILQPDSLRLVVQPFFEHPETVAAGGTIRVMNGCVVRQGFLARARLPKSSLALFQVVEYIRAFMLGRIGWSEINGLLVLSGAFSVFRKELVLAVGGYSKATITEDLEIIVRIHRHLAERGKPYHVAFVPEPVCWTEVPEDLATLRKQRIRWQQGLSECLALHWSLCGRKGSGVAGWFAFPFQVLYEWFGPLITVFAYAIVIAGFFTGALSVGSMAAFLFFDVAFGILISVQSLFLEQISFRVYPKASQILGLTLVAIVENLGYRQLNFLWRLKAVARWVLGRKAVWGAMKRLGTARDPGGPAPEGAA